MSSATKVISMRFAQDQVERLQRLARRLGRTPSETSALLVEESLRQAEFAYVDFRISPVGRQAYIQGSSLAVWEVIMVARAYGMDVAQTADHLNWQTDKVKAALNYYKAFPEEIDEALAENDSYDFERVSRMLPNAELAFINDSDELSYEA